jgi:hypothetical protein
MMDNSREATRTMKIIRIPTTLSRLFLSQTVGVWRLQPGTSSKWYLLAAAGRLQCHGPLNKRDLLRSRVRFCVVAGTGTITRLDCSSSYYTYTTLLDCLLVDERSPVLPRFVGGYWIVGGAQPAQHVATLNGIRCCCKVI